VAAAQRRAARAEERHQRLHARAMKLQAKANELEYAAAEVEDFEERLKQLMTIHHVVGESMDWPEISAKPAPFEPLKLRRWEEPALRKRDTFKASFFQRLFRKEQEHRARLEQEVVEAIQRDEISHQRELKLYRQKFEQWQDLSRLASAVIRGETEAYLKAFEELDPLSEMQEVGCNFEVSFPDEHTAVMDLTVESEKVVPRESKSLTRTGKLSAKSVPQSKFCELYQDYVCGCVLRTGRELFSFLPLTHVIVNVHATLLDSATGHFRVQPILSAAMPRKTIETMNFNAVDPSDAMALFPHRMGFKRSQEFFPISAVLTTEHLG